MNQKLNKNIKDCEEFKVELDLLRKELMMTTEKIKYSMKFEKSTEMLDKILSKQRLPSNKIKLGYDDSLKTTSSTEVKTKLLVKEDEGRYGNYNE